MNQFFGSLYVAMVASSKRSATALITLAVLSGMRSEAVLDPMGVTSDSRMMASDVLELCCWLSR